MKYYRAMVLAATILLAASGAAQGVDSSRVGQGAFVLRFGQVQPEHQALGAWLAAAPVLRDHLAWLSANLAMPQDVAVVFMSCGQVNAFYDPNSRSILFCFEWINHRIEDVRRVWPRATADAATDAVVRSMEFVLNHEVGHALVRQFGLPVLGREEDAADGFGTFILLERGGPQDVYSVLRGAESFGQMSLFEDASPADEHSTNSQRYYNILCWMVGSDQARFAAYAQQLGFPVRRQQLCPFEWNQLRSSWVQVLGSALKPRAPLPTAPAEPLTIVENKRIQIAAGQFWAAPFHIAFAQCRVQLNIQVLAGGELDAQTVVFEWPTYLTWQSGNATAQPLFNTGRVRQIEREVPVRGPGDFVVVVSNTHSAQAAKDVQATVRVACP